MNFGNMQMALRVGHRATREGWNGPGQYVSLQVPDAHSKMTVPYFYITTAAGSRIPWVPSQTDLWAEDWVLLP